MNDQNGERRHCKGCTLTMSSCCCPTFRVHPEHRPGQLAPCARCWRTMTRTTKPFNNPEQLRVLRLVNRWQHIVALRRRPLHSAYSRRSPSSTVRYMLLWLKCSVATPGCHGLTETLQSDISTDSMATRDLAHIMKNISDRWIWGPSP